jgi:hypothetical protein
MENIFRLGDILGSHGDEYKDVFWGVAQRDLVEVYRRFRGACYLHYNGYNYQANDSSELKDLARRLAKLRIQITPPDWTLIMSFL